MLEIEVKLSTSFHPQTNEQTEWMNQELEQYLKFFVDHRQKNWPEWLALVEFAVNNKIYLATKVSPFIVNYDMKLRMEVDIRKEGKMDKVAEFVKRMKKIQEEVVAVLRKVQKKIKRQADRRQKEVEK